VIELAPVGTAIVSATATAAEPSSVTMADDPAVIALTGDIAGGDADAVEATADVWPRPSSSPTVRRAKVPTVVAARSRCVGLLHRICGRGREIREL
jgi:hypothetical protein